MNETAKQQYSHFLDERCGLRRGYSNIILSKDDALKQYHLKAKQAWSEGEQFHGADKVMEKFLFSNSLIKPEFQDEARQVLDDLEQNGYGFKRDISMVKEAVNRFTEVHAPNAWKKPGYQESLQWVKDAIKPEYWLVSVQFDTVERFREFLSNKKASAGAMACYSTIKKKDDLRTKEMFELLQQLEAYALQEGTMSEPTIPGIRLQASIPLDENGQLTYRIDENGKRVLDFKFKTRLINMVSLPRIFEELHYSVSTQHYFGLLTWYAGGKNPQDMLQIINNNRMRFRYWDSMDYSAYDQSIPGWLIGDAFNIIKEWFLFKNKDDEKRWDVMVHDFIHKGLVSDKAGNITTIRDGVESGSMFTQIIDTLCNFIMIVYFCTLHEKQMFKDCTCNICGDDNVVFHDGWFDGEEYLNTIRKVFGVRGNATKSTLKKTRFDDVEYLSRVWKYHGVYRYWKELLIKLVYHERFRVYDEQVTPQIIFKAFIECYTLGMNEGFDIPRFYRLFPDCAVGSMTDEAKRSVGGVVAYEMIYGSQKRDRIGNVPKKSGAA
jgi:hypothetical protein